MIDIIFLIAVGYLLAILSIALWLRLYLTKGWAGSAPKTKQALKATLDKSEKPY